MKNLILLFSVGCATNPTPQVQTTNHYEQHRIKKCEDFQQEYEAALLWCNSPDGTLSEESKRASCLTVSNYERECPNG